MSRPSHNTVHKILLSPKLEGKAGREHLSGILRFLDAGHVWDIRIIRSQAELTVESVRDALADGTEGFLLSVPECRRIAPILKLIDATKRPVVMLDNHDEEVPSGRFCCIRFDTAEIVAAGLDHLNEILPHATLAFVPDSSGEPWSESRRTAFLALAAKRKATSRVFEGKTRQELTSWLKALPQPTALLAANDLTALRVVENCAQAGIDVPGHVAVLGIDNDELICGHTRPPIATIEPNFAGAGFLAAKTLQEMLDGHRVPRIRKMSVSVNRIVARGSARPQLGETALVRNALAFIRANALTIDVNDVARQLGVSRSLLDQAFHGHERSVAEEIREVRFAKALELLSDPNQAIGPVANLCGWRSEAHLTRLFKKRMGMSMRNWRALKVRASV